MFDGFESCVSECLMGRDALLLCDASCVDLILSKVFNLSAFGTELRCEVLEDPHKG